MKRLLKFLYLSSGDRQLLLKTFILLGLVRLGLCLLPFASLRRVLVGISRSTSSQQKVNQTEVAKLIWAVNQSSRYMPGGAKCLARALTTQVLMSWHGYSSELRIGVVKDEHKRLLAHAWLENEGEVVIGKLRNLADFKALPSLGGNDL